MVSESDRRPVVLITGAAHRIGRQIACTLAEQGWNVGLHYRRSSEEARQTLELLDAIGGHHCLLQADLASEQETRQLFSNAVELMGQVTAVVNNASIFEYDDAGSFSAECLTAHMMPNLAAPLILAQELHLHLVQSSS